MLLFSWKISATLDTFSNYSSELCNFEIWCDVTSGRLSIQLYKTPFVVISYTTPSDMTLYSVSQTSHKVGPWPTKQLGFIENLALTLCSDLLKDVTCKLLFNFIAHPEVKLSGCLNFPQCVHISMDVTVTHFGMHLKISFADFTRGLWYRVTSMCILWLLWNTYSTTWVS